MFKSFSQNKFILLLVAVLVFSGLIVVGLGWLENSSNSKLSTNSTQSLANYNSQIPNLSNNSNYSNSSQKIEQKNQNLGNSSSQIQSQNQTNSVKKITNAEFTKHFSKTDCWVSFDKKVYDMTTYLAIHPGGSGKLARFCSKEIDPVSANHSGGPFGSIKIQDILAPFYVGELIQ